MNSEMKALTCEPPPRQTTLASPNSTSAKYSGVENVSASRATGSEAATITTAATRPPASAANRVQPSALAGSPLLGHLVAVPQQRHVDGLAGDAEQDGREGSAVGAGHVHGGEQDEGRRDAHLVGEGQRQHDAHHQRQPGQHGDQQAEHQPDHQDEEVDRLEDGQEAVAEMEKHVLHGSGPPLSACCSSWATQSVKSWNGPTPSGSET